MSTRPSWRDKADKGHTDTYAVVGELVMMANALDYQIGSVVISVLDIGGSEWTKTIVATLDRSTKLEILKAHATHIRSEEWRKGVAEFCQKVDSVSKQRILHAIRQPRWKNGEWNLSPWLRRKY